MRCVLLPVSDRENAAEQCRIEGSKVHLGYPISCFQLFINGKMVNDEDMQEFTVQQVDLFNSDKVLHFDFSCLTSKK